MGKQGGRGQKRAAKVAARRLRLAQEEQRREQHAQMVVERFGDPRFVQRTNHGDGSATVRWAAGTPSDRMIRDGVAEQRAAFRAKFGRDPGPEDPLMFDPDADVPTFLTEQRMAVLFEEMVEGVESAGGDSAVVKTWRDLGYIVKTETQHLFSAAEVRAWEDTLAGHLDGQDGLDDEADVEFDDLVEVLDAVLRDAVARTIGDRSAEPGRAAAGMVIAGDLAALHDTSPDIEPEGAIVAAAAGEDPFLSIDGDGALGLSLAFSVLAGWLTAMRESRPGEDHAEDAVAWVQAELGDAPAAAAGHAAGLLGGGPAADITVLDLLNRLQHDFLPALVWITAGAVVSILDGDASLMPSVEELPDQPQEV